MRVIFTGVFRWAVLSMALIVGIVPRALAEEMAPTGAYKEGLVIGGWKVFPSVFVGAVFDDNIDQTPKGTNRWSDVGLRVVPNLSASYDGGMHKTFLYGVVDAQFFNANTVAATAGFSHSYEAMRDLVFNFLGNYTRETDIFNSALNFNNGAIGPVPSASSSIPIFINPFGTTPSVNPIAYNQFTGGASVTKTFGPAFASLSGTVFHIAFDHPDNVPIPFQTSHDATSVWIAGRAGYHVMPTLYVFVESDGILQRFNDSLFNTNGYRVIGGVGSDDPHSLFRGEVYGGYQTQFQEQQVVNAPGIPTDVNSGVFGGRLYYYPTRYWTFVGQVDETLGVSTTLSPSIPEGTPTRTITALVQTNYAISRGWWVGARFGYTRGEFIGISRVDDGWLAGASFNYEVWRNLLLTLDYQYTTVHSNATFSDFTRNVYTAGLTYKY